MADLAATITNDTVYAETCASIGLVFWAKKMLTIKPSNRYADVMERALYNGIISGMQLDGKRFFYVNPLEVNPGISAILYGHKHVLPERPGWYACACCPPNVARLLTSLGTYAWSESDDTIYSHLYIGAEAELEHADILVESKFPWEGNVVYTVTPKVLKEKFTLAIRIPSYVKKASVLINKIEISENMHITEGYLYIKREWSAGDTVMILFDLPVRKIYTNTKVRDNIDCVAFMRGPMVYCFEGADNGQNLQELHVCKNGRIEVGEYNEKELNGIVDLKIEGLRIFSEDALYFEGELKRKKERLKAIPYYAWGNRGSNQMRVWMHEA